MSTGVLLKRVFYFLIFAGAVVAITYGIMTLRDTVNSKVHNPDVFGDYALPVGLIILGGVVILYTGGRVLNYIL